MEHGLREGTTLLTWRWSYEGHPIHDLFQTAARLMISNRTVLVNGEITVDTNDPYKFYVALLGYDHLQVLCANSLLTSKYLHSID